MSYLSLISQIRTLLNRLADAISNLDVDVKGFKNAIENLKFVEDIHIYTKAIVQCFIELNENLKYIGQALDSGEKEPIVKGIKELENKLYYSMTNITKNTIKTKILMNLTVFLLIIANIITSYYSIIYYHEEYNIIFLILSMSIGFIILVGFSLKLLTTMFLIPLLPSISIIQLITILAKGYIDSYILILICFIGGSLLISVDLMLYILKMYKNAILTFISFSQNIESILYKISRIEIKKLDSDLQSLIKDFEKVYSNEAYELIKYIEEVSKMKS